MICTHSQSCGTGSPRHHGLPHESRKLQHGAPRGRPIRRRSAQSQPEEFDVVVIGAGISGIGAARYLTEAFPGKRVVVLEGRDNIGGTWDLFRYPGIRSDSDLHTFGYEFKPWKDRAAIAEAPRILDYLRETVQENNLGELIRLGHSVQRAAWSSTDARWTIDVRTADGDRHSKCVDKFGAWLGSPGDPGLEVCGCLSPTDL